MRAPDPATGEVFGCMQETRGSTGLAQLAEGYFLTKSALKQSASIAFLSLLQRFQTAKAARRCFAATVFSLMTCGARCEQE